MEILLKFGLKMFWKQRRALIEILPRVQERPEPPLPENDKKNTMIEK